jgi:threonine aldolase
MAHCGRGDEYLVGQLAHTYRYEGGGAAVLGSIQPQPLEHQPDGTLALKDIEAAIKPDDPHFARSTLLCLENTLHGRIIAQSYLEAATTLAHGRGLNAHLDGARLFNAAVGSGVPAREIAKSFDSVTVCFSKGLGCPAGAALVGSKEFIARARRWRARRSMRWSTTSSAWPKTMRGPSAWPKACKACRAWRSSRRRPTWCSSTSRPTRRPAPSSG